MEITHLPIYAFTKLSFTTAKSSLQIDPFMQNEPNFQKSQMNVTSLITVAYENIANWTLGENEPNTNPIRTQTNPILSAVGGLQMNVSAVLTKDYDNEQRTMNNERLCKTNPIQTQSCPPLEGLSASGGFIRLWRVYPPLEGLSAIPLAKADSKRRKITCFRTNCCYNAWVHRPRTMN